MEDNEECDERPEVTELARQREAVGATTGCWLGGSLRRGGGGVCRDGEEGGGFHGGMSMTCVDVRDEGILGYILRAERG